MNTEHSQPKQNSTQDLNREESIFVEGGLFVVFEGIDGTGKSTQLHMLTEKLQQLGYAVVPTCEPTDGTFGRRIRELFVDRKTVSHEEELELFIADREQHVQEVIAPALKDGRIVACDRYYLSTLAYQGANGIDPDLIMDKNKDFPVPDLAIIIEIDPALGLRRIRDQRNESPDTFEGESNLRKVAAIFSSMQHPYILRIDGSDTIESIHRQIVNAVKEKLSQKRVKSVDN